MGVKQPVTLIEGQPVGRCGESINGRPRRRASALRRRRTPAASWVQPVTMKAASSGADKRRESGSASPSACAYLIRPIAHELQLIDACTSGCKRLAAEGVRHAENVTDDLSSLLGSRRLPDRTRDPVVPNRSPMFGRSRGRNAIRGHGLPENGEHDRAGDPAMRGHAEGVGVQSPSQLANFHVSTAGTVEIGEPVNR